MRRWLRRRRVRRMMPRLALWGWRRGEWGYAVVPVERAYAQSLPIVGCADLARAYVTVATR